MDSVEKSEEYLKIKDDMEKLVEIYMKNKNINESIPGYIEIYWGVKKQLLKEIYNIEWKNPKELNPDIIFD